MAGALWGVSISPVSDTLFSGLESQFSIPDNPKGDVIVLLGGGARDMAPDMSGTGAPSGDMLERLVTAVRLQKALGIPVIVSGGSGFSTKAPEAPIVRRFLIDLGVPSQQVIVEDKSRDTIENARYTAKIINDFKLKKPILVTSAYHMQRSVFSFERAKLRVVPFPAGFRTWKPRQYGWEDYFPDADALLDSTIALKEHIGILFYKVAY
jgi:uncharacterized SAM-binding protein YcdF (DUF218 family)